METFSLVILESFSTNSTVDDSDEEEYKSRIRAKM
jgi:hypothetical protein